MPVNLQQIWGQIMQMGENALLGEALLCQRRELAQKLLQEHAHQLEELTRRVERAVLQNHALRCAIPVREALNAAFPCPEVGMPYALLAADGSQINPSRHDRVEYGLINSAVVRFYPHTGQAPGVQIESHLLYRDMAKPSEPFNEETVALARDIHERRFLAKLAALEKPPIIALTDGPLELYREPKDEPYFAKRFEEYLGALDSLADLEVAPAGYVDKPQADLVIRLLELALLKDEVLDKAGLEHPLQHISDASIFGRILKPGERSAVFGLYSRSASSFNKYAGRLALHFFYLNVSHDEHGWPVRVEIPAWVAQNRGLLDLLHGALINQCRKMGHHPYPYALVRADEEARVEFQEKEKVGRMIEAELVKRGLTLGQKSNKQASKDLSYPRR